jgi:hypothetical protein
MLSLKEKSISSFLLSETTEMVRNSFSGLGSNDSSNEQMKSIDI